MAPIAARADDTVASVLFGHAARTPDAAFLVFERAPGEIETIAYAAMAARATSTAGALQRLGVGPGDRFHCHLTNRPDFYDAWFAAAVLGAVHESHTVRYWREQLAARVGMSEAEIATLMSALEVFCLRHAVSPEDVLDRWEAFPELTVRRRPDAVESPNLAVESFLVHNGINIFGDLICVAWRPEDLAAQGAQFVQHPLPSVR